MIFKTTQQILNEPWQPNFINDLLGVIKFEVTPAADCWPQGKEIALSDIKLWEQIYYKGAHVGIWAAWNPKIEFYLVTYNLFLENPQGIRVFSGSDANYQVWKLAKELGITLPINRVWIDSIDGSDKSLLLTPG